MDLTALSSIMKLIEVVMKAADGVKVNKMLSKQLAQRLGGIRAKLTDWAQKKRAVVPKFAHELEELKKVLEEAVDLVTSYQPQHWVRKVYNNFDAKLQFDALHMRLSACVENLQLGLLEDLVQMAQERQQAAEQDKGDLLQAVERLLTEIQELPNRMGSLVLRNLKQELLVVSANIHESFDGRGCRVQQGWEELDREQIKLGPRIGHGSFSVVYRGTWRGAEVAVKEMVEDERDPLRRQEFLKEIRLISKLRHPNIVQLFGACTQGQRCPLMVMELVPDGSLYHVMRDRSRSQRSGGGERNAGGAFSKGEALAVMLSIARGVEYLHSRGIVHRDLKAHNVLMRIESEERGRYEVKLTDFGMSRIKGSSIMYSPVGTSLWIAPEVHRRGAYTEKVDAYSFAITCFEVLTGELPFEGRGDFDLFSDIILCGRRPELPPDCDPDVGALIRQCWHADPAERPSFARIVETLQGIQKSRGFEQQVERLDPVLAELVDTVEGGGCPNSLEPDACQSPPDDESLTIVKHVLYVPEVAGVRGGTNDSTGVSWLSDHNVSTGSSTDRDGPGPIDATTDGVEDGAVASAADVSSTSVDVPSAEPTDAFHEQAADMPEPLVAKADEFVESAQPGEIVVEALPAVSEGGSDVEPVANEALGRLPAGGKLLEVETSSLVVQTDPQQTSGNLVDSDPQTADVISASDAPANVDAVEGREGVETGHLSVPASNLGSLMEGYDSARVEVNDPALERLETIWNSLRWPMQALKETERRLDDANILRARHLNSGGGTDEPVTGVSKAEEEWRRLRALDNSDIEKDRRKADNQVGDTMLIHSSVNAPGARQPVPVIEVGGATDEPVTGVSKAEEAWLRLRALGNSGEKGRKTETQVDDALLIQKAVNVPSAGQSVPVPVIEVGATDEPLAKLSKAEEAWRHLLGEDRSKAEVVDDLSIDDLYLSVDDMSMDDLSDLDWSEGVGAQLDEELKQSEPPERTKADKTVRLGRPSFLGLLAASLKGAFSQDGSKYNPYRGMRRNKGKPVDHFQEPLTTALVFNVSFPCAPNQRTRPALEGETMP